MVATVEFGDLEVGMNTEYGVVSAVYEDAVDFMDLEDFERFESTGEYDNDAVEQYEVDALKSYVLVEFYGFVN